MGGHSLSSPMPFGRLTLFLYREPDVLSVVQRPSIFSLQPEYDVLLPHAAFINTSCPLKLELFEVKMQLLIVASTSFVLQDIAIAPPPARCSVVSRFLLPANVQSLIETVLALIETAPPYHASAVLLKNSDLSIMTSVQQEQEIAPPPLVAVLLEKVEPVIVRKPLEVGEYSTVDGQETLLRNFELMILRLFEVVYRIPVLLDSFSLLQFLIVLSFMFNMSVSI